MRHQEGSFSQAGAAIHFGRRKSISKEMDLSAGVWRVGEADVGCSDQERFKTELEFVQCLASAQYINWLAQNRYFEDKSFVAYLAYLKYWQQPQYASYIIYPHCLYFLDLLQSKDFRSSMANSNAKELINSQQVYFYQHYRNNRLQ